jgi:phosphoribosylanthranilate isomerase
MSSYLRVKICGITNEADAVQAADLGADAIGLNFYKESPRCITPAKAESIILNLPPFVEPVGIFVSSARPPGVEDIPKLGLGIRTVQVHSPDQNMFLSIPFEIVGVRLIPVFSVGENTDLSRISHYLKECGKRRANLLAAILVDARVPGQFGGTGKTVPWELLADFQPEVPLILAGGLTPENVAEAVRIVRPWGVDVASGVEKSPGVKDPEKMKRFIENAREAAAK